MAELDAQLRLDIDQALRDVDRLQGALDRAIAPIEIEVDDRQALELEDTLREVERIANRAATEVASIDLAAGRAEANFEDLARALNISEDAARRLTGEVLQSQAAANRLEDATRDVARQLGLSDSEANRLVGSLRDADRAAEAIDVTSLTLAGRFASLRTSAAAIAATLGSIGGGVALGAAVIGANAAIQSFARLEDSINAVNVVFGSAAAGVIQFGEAAAASAGLSQEAFNQAVVPIGSLLQNFGFDARQAADGAVVLVQRAADLASVMGGTVQDALLAVGAALRGEADPLERYGASISAARVQSFALAEGLAQTVADITPAITLQARYGLILRDTARVSGDFANTSGDLANAQRSASGALQNFVTDIGEELAPALETILVLLPEVVEGVRQLVPGFAAAGDSAANFFASVGEGGGFRTEFAAIEAGLEIATTGAGLFTEFGLAVGGMALDVRHLDGDFTRMSAAVERGGALIERSFTRGIGIALANALDKGTDSAEAFRTAMAQTARSSQILTTFTKAYRDFAIAADLSGLELRDVTQEMIDNAQALELTATEVDFLKTQLALLNSTLFEDIEAVRQFNFEMRNLGDDAIPVAVSALEGIQIAASEAGVSLGDIVTGVDPVAQKLGETLTPAQNTALAFLAINTESGAAAAILQERLRPALADVSGALIDLNDNGKLSVSEFITNMEAMTEAALAFRADFANVAIISPELAAHIATLPDEARNLLLASFRADPANILVAEIALLGTPEAIAASFRETVGAALDLVRTTGPNDEARTTLLAQLTDSEEFSAGELTALTQILNGALDVSMADVQPPSFTPVFVRSFEDLNQAQITASMNAALGASHADLELPTITPAMLRSIQGMDSAAIARAVQTATSGPVDSALNASFADVELPPFTPIITDSIASANTAKVTAEMNAVLDVSFADVTLPDPTDQVAEAYGKIDPKEVTTALDAALGVSFADIDLSDEGAKAAATYWDGFAAYAPGAIPVVRASVTKTLKGGIQEYSPSKLFLDAGVRSADAFWLGFEQTEGKISPAGMLAALDAALGASFADVEVPDFTPVISRGIQGVNTAQTQTELEAALSASFADIELPGFTPLVVASVEGTNTAAVTAEMQAALGVSFADLELPEFSPTVTPTVGRISAAELDAALGVSFADVEAPEFIPTVGEVSTADMEAALAVSFANVEVPAFIPTVGKISTADTTAALDAALAVSFADVVFPEFNPIFTPTVGKVSSKEVSAAFDAAMAVSFADVTAPEFTSTVVASVEETDTAAVTASINAALGVSFADVTLPDPTAQVVEAFGKLSSQEITAAFDPALRASFADVDLSDEGVEARGTFMSGLSTPTSGETGRLRQSILQTVNGAIQRQSPPKLFLDAGLDSAEAFWMGFEQVDMSLRVPVPQMTGKISTTTAAPAAGGEAGFTFAPTYVNTETRDLETVVARSEQLMGAVSGILNGRFKL